MSECSDPRSRLKAARLRVRDQARLRAALKLERSATILESGVSSPTPFDYISAYSTILERFRGEPYSYSVSSPYDRKYGRNFPLYQSETELSLLRAPSRVLCQTNCYAQALVGGLKSYVIGPGYSYRAKEREKVTVPPGLVEAVQEVVDRFLRRNQWNAADPWQLLDELPLRPIEGEAFERSLRDGEACLIHYADPDESGDTDVRWVESEFITQPPGSRWEEWSFGWKVPPDDEQKKLAAWISFSGLAAEGEEVPVRDLSFLARNSDRIAKRGVPDFAFDSYHALQTAQRLRSALATGGAQKASIVGVRQHRAQTPTQTQAFSDSLADLQQVDLVTGQLQNTRHFREGEWEDIPENLEYVHGPSTDNEAALVEVLNACLRGAVVRWNGFEWLVSADASSNSYANALAAQSPAVQRVRCEQDQSYKPFFARSIAIAVRNACDAGRIRVSGYTFSWQEVRGLVEVQIEAPSPEVQDKASEAQANQIRIQGGWKSRQTVAQEEGLDWETEQENISAYNEANPPQSPLPMPGEGGEERQHP